MSHSNSHSTTILGFFSSHWCRAWMGQVNQMIFCAFILDDAYVNGIRLWTTFRVLSSVICDWIVRYEIGPFQKGLTCRFLQTSSRVKNGFIFFYDKMSLWGRNSYLGLICLQHKKVMFPKEIIQIPWLGHMEGVKAENGPPLHGAASASPSGFSPPRSPTVDPAAAKVPSSISSSSSSSSSSMAEVTKCCFRNDTGSK